MIEVKLFDDIDFACPYNEPTAAENHSDPYEYLTIYMVTFITEQLVITLVAVIIVLILPFLVKEHSHLHRRVTPPLLLYRLRLRL